MVARSLKLVEERERERESGRGINYIHNSSILPERHEALAEAESRDLQYLQELEGHSNPVSELRFLQHLRDELIDDVFSLRLQGTFG